MNGIMRIGHTTLHPNPTLHRVKVFALKSIRPHILNSLRDFIHIWPDGRYRSKVFISAIPTPGVALEFS